MPDKIITAGVAALCAVCLQAAMATPIGAALERPAVRSAHAARAVLQSAAQAGPRLVAVGERGIVVLSDDAGRNWRQVEVPVSVGLTAVRFVDAQHGWIVGHGGLVLSSVDGGQGWTLQLDGRQAAQLLLKDPHIASNPKALADAQRLVDDGPDKPFLDAHFFDAQHGLVVGAFNLAFSTADGGKSWQPISSRLDNPRGLHLYAVRARGDEVVIAGEQGLVLRSTDRGHSFRRLSLPYKGSYFTVELPGAGEIVLGGLRGNAWKSTDGGASWTQLTVPVPVSFTASAIDADGRLWLGNQAGMVFSYDGTALMPTAAKLPPLTGLLPLPGGQAVALSISGVALTNLGSPK